MDARRHVVGDFCTSNVGARTGAEWRLADEVSQPALKPSTAIFYKDCETGARNVRTP